MYAVQSILFLCILCTSYSDWVSEWMLPVQDQINGDPARKTNNEVKLLNEEVPAIITKDSPENPNRSNNNVYRINKNDISTANLKIKLEDTLQDAKALTETLRGQIIALTSREKSLKEAITNGRSGISIVTVSTMGQLPRSYIIRDGFWTLCNGLIQFPVATPTTNLFSELFSAPRCIGQEISTKRDPCVFNSVIKYETIPTRRLLEYAEDDYLCLKMTFNSTLEQYLSVPQRLINDTCKNGIIRSLGDNILECGVRVLSEYSFYPYRSSSAATLPLEYCTEKDGSCKLIVAWHVSNTTIENFEFLKNEENFKKFFIKSGTYIEHVI